MAHDEPAGQVAARPGMTSPSSGSWNRWPPPAATSSHDQFFSVVKKVRPSPSAGTIGALSKAGLNSAIAGPKLKSGAPRPGPSKAPISLLKAGPLRLGASISSGNVAKTGPPRPGPSSDAAPPSKTSVSRPGPPPGVSSKVRHPSAGVARARAPSGGAPRPAPDPFRPKPSLLAPKPRMSWDLDLLTDGSPEDDGDFATDLEQSPAFVDRRPTSQPPPRSILDRVNAAAPMTDKALFSKSSRGRPPKNPGEPRVPRKYVKKKHAANGAGGHAESAGVPHAKPKWKGASDKLRNDFDKAKEKRRRRKEKLIAVRMDGSVPQMVTLLPRDPANPAPPVALHSPTKDDQAPKITSPLRKLSGGSPGDLTHGKPEPKPLFEHIDEDWAVIKKSLEKTKVKKERKVSEAGSPLKASSATLTPSPSKKSDRSDEPSTDDDVGNNLNAPLHNLERLQDQMIQNLMDDGALAALKRKHKQKEVHMFKKKKMSDYWKSKLVPGNSSSEMKMKRPYTMRPLTSDNVQHMEDAIAAVLAAPSPEASPEKRPAAGTGSPPRPKPAASRAPGRAPPQLQRRPSGLETQPPAAPSASQPAALPAAHSSPRVAMPARRPSLPPSAGRQPPPAAAAGPERRDSAEPESDQAAATRLQQVKQELAARFLSDLHEQRARLQAAEQQQVAWQQQQESVAAAHLQQQLGMRPLIRVRRRRAGQPRIVRLTEASFQAGNTVTAASVGDDADDDGCVAPELAAPLQISMPAGKVKEFLDTAHVSRYRRTCESAMLASVVMPQETAERMVFVSERPLPPELEQTLVPTGQGLCLPGLPGAPWPAEQMDPALATGSWPAGSPAPGVGWYETPPPPADQAAGVGWYGPPLTPAGATAGWFGGAMSPATGFAWPGQPTDGSLLIAAPSATPTTAPALVTASPATAAAPETAAAAVPSGAPEEDPADDSMEDKPLYIALPATPTPERAATPAGSTRETPLSVSPRVVPTAAGWRPSLGGIAAPGTPAGFSPRRTSGGGSARPVDPESLHFVCNRCPERLATLSEQVYHEIRLHMIEEGLFRCLGCPMLLPLKGDVSVVLDGLLDHYMKHVDCDGRLLAVDASADFFRCEFCPRMFEDPAAYGAHEVQCRSLTHTCATCQGRFETGDVLKWHEVDHLRAADGKYCCDHCDSKFTKREQLLGHRRFHFKDKNVECPKCGKKFMTTGMLAMHNKWKHSQGPCRFCGRPFTSATARQAHEEHMHLKYMMHMCNVCHFRVMTATQLRVHKRTHSDEKPHRCTTCDESFVSQNLLRKHRTAQHSETRQEAADAVAEGATVAAEPNPAPAESSPSQSGGESARAADGTLTPAELRQLFERYRATWTGPKDGMTLSDLDTDEDEEEKQDLIDIQAKEELFKKKDKNSFSIWSCPVCKAFFTKLWGVRAHITLKHPGTSMRPVLHDDKDTSAGSKQDFLKEIKRNAKTAKRELKLEAKRQARIAAYGDEVPRRGRPRKFSLSERPPVVRKPLDPSQPRKRGRPRKNPDDPPASPRPAGDAPPPPPPPPEPKPEPPPDHVERRRWKCLTCADQSQSYDDLVTHTYLAHPDADLPRFQVVVTYVPKPAPKTPTVPATAAEPATPPAPAAASEAEAQQDHDAAILDAARVRGAEKRRAPSATKVPAGAKRRSVPAAATPGGATRDRGRGRGSSGGGRGGGGGGGRGRAGGGDSYRKSYSNASRRYKAEDEAAPAAAAGDDADKLYCYCQSPYDEVSEMIGCDNDDCKHEWFHFECVGIVIAPKGKWFCPDCAVKKADK